MLLFSKEGTKFLLDYLIMVQHTGGKTKEGLRSKKSSLKIAITHLIKNYYFNVGNVTIEIDRAPFWANLFYIPMKKNTIFF